MAYPHYRSQFGDTSLTKVFVGGLAWETPTEEMRKYFEQFGEILEAVVIKDKITGNSKGYGFVTFCDPESARKACAEPNPVIDGRRANCNIAALGRPRTSPPTGTGRNQGGHPHQVGIGPAATPPGSSSYASGGIPAQSVPPPPHPPVFYSPYGFQPYSPDHAFHHHRRHHPPPYYHLHHHRLAYSSPTPTTASPYYYGYSPFPRGTFGAAQLPPPAPSSYLYYPHPAPPPAEPSAVPTLSAAPPFQPPPPPTLQPVRHLFPRPTDSQQTNPQWSSAEQQTAVPTSASSSPSSTIPVYCLAPIHQTSSI